MIEVAGYVDVKCITISSGVQLGISIAAVSLLTQCTKHCVT